MNEKKVRLNSLRDENTKNVRLDTEKVNKLRKYVLTDYVNELK